MLTLANVLTLFEILNALGGAGVAFTKLVDWLKNEHKNDPAAVLPPEHVTQVRQALTAWHAPAVAVVGSSPQALAQFSLRNRAGALREHADQLDVLADSLPTEFSASASSVLRYLAVKDSI